MKVNSVEAAKVNAVSLCPTERERRLKFHFLAVGPAGGGNDDVGFERVAGTWMDLMLSSCKSTQGYRAIQELDQVLNLLGKI